MNSNQVVPQLSGSKRTYEMAHAEVGVKLSSKKDYYDYMSSQRGPKTCWSVGIPCERLPLFPHPCTTVRLLEYEKC